ncbi:hypothetical protein BDV27DRAFT_132624 [Aspergillus caelatus]|uniref:Uncharacterized protein n=1 Tax=Aspergillus caelatus TaxID=61420 RepID=A0A5N6ZW08_9EURO|nr:uncharacterized protein BDV27DRAFT_132624 [Aspergillus caelatus]KAE8361692.1 hypothetical protein BDV27DRAFT_132624 [Aspergillus caelatus]
MFYTPRISEAPSTLILFSKFFRWTLSRTSVLKNNDAVNDNYPKSFSRDCPRLNRLRQELRRKFGRAFNNISKMLG